MESLWAIEVYSNIQATKGSFLSFIECVILPAISVRYAWVIKTRRPDNCWKGMAKKWMISHFPLWKCLRNFEPLMLIIHLIQCYKQWLTTIPPHQCHNNITSIHQKELSYFVHSLKCEFNHIFKDLIGDTIALLKTKLKVHNNHCKAQPQISNDQ